MSDLALAPTGLYQRSLGPRHATLLTDTFTAKNFRVVNWKILLRLFSITLLSNKRVKALSIEVLSGQFSDCK